MTEKVMDYDIDPTSLCDKMYQWHWDRNLVEGSTAQAQFIKLMEEAGEYAGNLSRGRSTSDDIGDMIVVLINLAAQEGKTLGECMNVAWNDIKDRDGRMVGGVYVKKEDL